jgi:hypothetical protein
MGSSQANLLHDSVGHRGLSSHPRYGLRSFSLLFGFFFLSDQRLALTQDGTSHGQHTERRTGNKKCQQQQNQGSLGAGVPKKMQHHLVGIFQREAKKHQEQAYRKEPENYLHESGRISKEIRACILRQKKWHPVGCHWNLSHTLSYR